MAGLKVDSPIVSLVEQLLLEFFARVILIFAQLTSSSWMRDLNSAALMRGWSRVDAALTSSGYSPSKLSRSSPVGDRIVNLPFL